MSIASLREANDRRYEGNQFRESMCWISANYYDMDEIIAGDEQVTFMLEQNTPKEILSLVRKQKSTVIPLQGLQCNIKIWQANSLCQCGHVFAGKFNPTKFENLKASASVTRLTDSKRYFYETHQQVSRLLTPEDGQRVATDLLKIFLLRLKPIFLQTLDLENTRSLMFSEIEMTVVNKGQYTEHRLQNWKRNIPRQKQGLRRKFRRYT
ncbi:hypothetical protein M3Y98_00652100 [Aphelenchoides besseyi]|nr:hypothetical protein M3Y98_00652100 [Aphelenchoides besseyi]KAI6208689.1 hypothetical protein M3Y96_00141500 [Aphelenchoides besseyi]